MTSSAESVCAMLVTYADRAALCRQVVRRLVDLGVSRIVLVDNASAPESQHSLKALEQQVAEVTVVVNDENVGSGGGFRRALEIALSGEEDFFLLLDDDNLPRPDCVDQLKTAHKLLEPGHEAGILLYANRASTRRTDARVFSTGFIKSYSPNSFCSFVLKERIIGKLQAHYRRDVGLQEVNYPIVRVRYGPYGGMFGRRAIFANAGLPRDDYFVYADDHEYATRIEAAGVAQFLVEPARVDDLDVSFEPGYFLLSKKVSPLRVYYQIRNHAHLSQLFVESGRAYSLNRAAFIFWETAKGGTGWFTDPKATWKRWRLLRRAMSDGEAGRLGRSFRE